VGLGTIKSILGSCSICHGIYIGTGYGQMSNRTLITLQYDQIAALAP